MKITFGPNEPGGKTLVLHNRTRQEAKRALAKSSQFGIPVRVQADGDDFSRLCTALKRARQDLDESIEDVHAFHAPSECINLVVHDSQKQVHKLLEEFGFTPETFLNELDRRVSYKFLSQWDWFGVAEDT